MTGEQDHTFMARALRLAKRGLYTTDPNPRVGCVLVNGDSIVGEGWHERTGGPHAERVALDAAGESARGATAYVTLEPCCHHGRTSPCTDALIAAGIVRVVFASEDPNPDVSGGGARQLIDAGIDVVGGVMSAGADTWNVGYIKRRRTGRPYVRSKIATSLDGRTALANGASQWITGPAARADVQRLRARSSAVLTGVGTILSDDPSLNVRDAALGNVLQPMRVIADSRLRTPVDARTLGLPGAVRIYCVDGQVANDLSAAGAEVEVVAAVDGRASLPALLDSLGVLQINELLVEAGPGLNGALMTAGLIDELIVYSASHILGSGARGMFDGPLLETMAERVELQLVDLRRVGDDCRLTYRMVR